MRHTLLVTAAAVCVLGSSAFAATESSPEQGKPFVGVVKVDITTPLRSTPIALAQSSDRLAQSSDRNDRSERDRNSERDRDRDDKDCREGRDHDVVSRSKKCKGNNGFGNGGGDGSPNGKPDGNR